MHPEAIPQPNKPEKFQPKISKVVNPETNEPLTREIRYDENGAPKEFLLFNDKGEILNYENIPGLKEFELDALTLKALSSLDKKSKTPEKRPQ